MKTLSRQLAAGLSAVLALSAGAVVTAAPALAATTPPPWQNPATDPNNTGTLRFYNASGVQITSGSTSVPVASYVEALGLSPASGHHLATLYAYTPNPGLNPGAWSGAALSGSTTYPNGSAPGSLATDTNPVVTEVTSGTSADVTLDDYDTNSYPNTSTTAGYQNVYELRVKTSGPGGTDIHYASADVLVDPSAHTWTEVYPTGTTTPATAPGAPTALSATSGNGSLSLSWTAPASNGGSPITGYTVTYTPSGGSATSRATGSTATSYTLTGLTNGTSYNVTVAAINAIGTGAPSSTASGTPAATVPSAPTGVSAVAHSGSATVTFAPPYDGGSAITSYTVHASTGETASGASSPITIAVPNDTVRTFTVTATNTIGTGTASAASNAVAYYTSALSIHVTSGGVVAGSYLRVYGQLTSGPASALPAVLYAYPAGHTATATSFTTSSTGAYSVLVRAVYNTTYKVVYSGDSLHSAVTSSVVKVLSKAKVTITSPKFGTKTTTRTVAIAGITYPNKARAYIYLYEVTSAGTVRLAIGRVASNGTFRFAHTFARGTHRLYVAVATTTTNAAGRSANLVLYEL